MTQDARRVVELRLAHSQAATKKFNSIADRQIDGTMPDTLQAWGAQRTGRWAGRGLQLQNLKRPTMADPEGVAELLVKNPQLWKACYALEDLGSLVRSAIKAPEGKRLVVADLANIESRVAGWVAGDLALQQVFSQGQDPYKSFAVQWLGIPYDQVDKKTRNMCKAPALGCGFGFGAIGLMKYADSMGIEMDKITAQSAVKAFRSTYKAIPATWRRLEGRWRLSMIEGCSGPMQREGRFLTIALPSGRKLYYDAPEVGEEWGAWAEMKDIGSVSLGWFDTEAEANAAAQSWLKKYPEILSLRVQSRPVLSYLGQNQFTNQWERIRTYGAKLFENIVQAIARDILAYGMMLYTKEGGTVIGHVHDEIIALEDADSAAAWLGLMLYYLKAIAPWAAGLILDAEGYVSRSYRK